MGIMAKMLHCTLSEIALCYIYLLQYSWLASPRWGCSPPSDSDHFSVIVGQDGGKADGLDSVTKGDRSRQLDDGEVIIQGSFGDHPTSHHSYQLGNQNVLELWMCDPLALTISVIYM